jgi:hypothetical protein
MKNRRFSAVIIYGWLAAWLADCSTDSTGRVSFPIVPDSLKVSPNETLSFAVKAKGIQITSLIAPSRQESNRLAVLSNRGAPGKLEKWVAESAVYPIRLDNPGICCATIPVDGPIPRPEADLTLERAPVRQRQNSMSNKSENKIQSRKDSDESKVLFTRRVAVETPAHISFRYQSHAECPFVAADSAHRSLQRTLRNPMG